jgi:diguanylate cyclase (GGDEF)-like protein
MPPKQHWGSIPFAFSVLLIIAAGAIAFSVAPQANPVLYTGILPTVGIISALLCFLIGHFSYPRVHNLKVYLAGYLTGLVGLFKFIWFSDAGIPPAMSVILLLTGLCNVLLILSVPSFVKYATARTTAWTITILEGLFLLIVRFNPGASNWAEPLRPIALFSIQAIVGILILTGIAVLSRKLLRDDFHLGGVIAGLGLCYAVLWLSPFITANGFGIVLSAATPLFLILGILFHWFTRIEHRVSYDPLLHIYNRNYCSRVIAEQSTLATSPPFAIAMVDIDHFKAVNDTHGHQAGDQVLQSVAQVIQHAVIPDGIACRYGGEEIIVFFQKKTVKEIAPIIENLRAEVEKTKVACGKKTLSVTVSCGISARETEAQSIMDVIAAADKALYKAKDGGRNQVKTQNAPNGLSKKK